MSQRTDARVPSTDRSAGTLISPGTDSRFAIGADESAVLCGLLHALSAEADLEDPQLLSGLAEIGQLARRLGGFSSSTTSSVGLV